MDLPHWRLNSFNFCHVPEGRRWQLTGLAGALTVVY